MRRFGSIAFALVFEASGLVPAILVSVGIALYGLMGPFAAAMIQRFGLRLIVPCAASATSIVTR